MPSSSVRQATRLARPRHRAVRRWPGALGLAAALILGVFAVPLLSAGGNAWAVQRNLSAAVAALTAGDLDRAGDRSAAAREDALDMARSTEGLSGVLWSALPGGDADKQDVRHISRGLVDLTAVVTTVVDAYPDDSPEDGFLLSPDGSVDVAALESVLSRFPQLRARIASAAGAADAVSGSTSLVGPLLARVADRLEARLAPAGSAMEVLAPLAPVLPRLLGSESEQDLLVVLLNPAEQRYSGGATLSFLPLTVKDGEVREGRALIGAEDRTTFERFSWPAVEDNPFHEEGQDLRLSTATLAPSWSVSGEELLRAWDEREGTTMDGLVAVDVVALQALMRFTGPIEVTGYGTLTSENLARQLVGSYEELTTPEVFLARRIGAAELVGEFQRRVVQAADLPGKLATLVASADARRLAVYHREPAIARALRQAGLTADLSRTAYDYVGVFNQALTGTKSDFWQRRAVRQDVRLRRDGSARVRLAIEVYNDSPPPAPDVFPGYAAYVRRYHDMALAAFLPRGVSDVRATLDGARTQIDIDEFRGRPFTQLELHFEPRQRRTLTLTYEVPRAAARTATGLSYRLDVDPHSLVDPQAYSVTVRWPAGFVALEPPEGWTVEGDTATYRTDDLAFSPRWRLQLVRS